MQAAGRRLCADGERSSQGRGDQRPAAAEQLLTGTTVSPTMPGDRAWMEESSWSPLEAIPPHHSQACGESEACLQLRPAPGMACLGS